MNYKPPFTMTYAGPHCIPTYWDADSALVRSDDVLALLNTPRQGEQAAPPQPSADISPFGRSVLEAAVEAELKAHPEWKEPSAPAGERARAAFFCEVSADNAETDGKPAAEIAWLRLAARALRERTGVTEGVVLEREGQVAAWTPTMYSGDYPPYINFTIGYPTREECDKNRRDSGPWVRITVRLPTIHGGPCGATSTVYLNRDMWVKFLTLIPEVEKRHHAHRFCDGLF